ncbi:TadE family protein [Neorhizobium galegae bv. orientalis str. HAMBI 540]|uniref:TadE family protein n=2 Tax=Neorhizobium galegae TaxID=399 RepID=A0A068SN37_NEOGA|nr:TadE family protein [Neorhizobium galegae bv. orientalis str. HAMBI 540]
MARMQRFKALLRNEQGAAAVEFALLVLPFFIFLFCILDMALMFFVDSALDSALHTAARSVRVGSAHSNNWNLATFKNNVCDGMAFAFGCKDELLIRTTAMPDFSSMSFTSPVSGGVLSVTESFSPAASGDYVMIQAFLPWNSLLATVGANVNTLADGTYVLSAAVIFRNEPF